MSGVKIDPLPAIQPFYLLLKTIKIMDLKIIPPPSSGLQPKLIESFDPSETMAALQQALVREFFGGCNHDPTPCVLLSHTVPM